MLINQSDVNIRDDIILWIGETDSKQGAKKSEKDFAFQLYSTILINQCDVNIRDDIILWIGQTDT
jgi:hypothetical protein